MRKILILGASGFIGSSLVEKMYSKDYELSVILRDYSKAGFISRFKNVKKYYFKLNENKKLSSVIAKNDIIINCIHDFGNQKFNINLINDICQNLVQNNKKLIHLSTISCYQPFAGKKEINENTTFNLNTFQYAKNKNEIDNIILKYNKDSKINMTILQPTIVYGKYSKPWTERIINQLNNGKMVIPSDSGNCNLIHIDDLCEAIIKSIPSKFNGEKIIISNPEEVKWVEFYNFFNSLFDENKLILEESKLINKNLKNPFKLVKIILGDPKKAFMWEPMKSFLMQLKNKLTPKMKNTIKNIYSVYKKFSPSPVFLPDSMLMDVYLDKSKVDTDKMKTFLQFEPIVDFKEGQKLIKSYYDLSYKDYHRNE